MEYHQVTINYQDTAKIKLLLNVLQKYSTDIPLELLTKLMNFEDTLSLQRWLFSLGIQGIEVEAKTRKLIITPSFTDEINKKLVEYNENSHQGVDEHDSSSSEFISSRRLQSAKLQMQLRETRLSKYQGIILVQYEAEILQELEKFIGQVINPVSDITWNGCEFESENNHVVGIGLNNSKLTVLPLNFWDLSNLKTLFLTGNKLTTLPSNIGQFTNLEVLNLYNNQLAIFPSSICKIFSLKSLDLYENQLTTLSQDINNLKGLRTLRLSNNKFSSLPDSIWNIQSLQSLSLSNNNLTSLPLSLGNLSNLEVLSLGGNQLTMLPDSIGNLSNLQILKLDDNQLVSLPPNIKRLKNLHYLSLKNNPQIGKKAVTIGGFEMNIENLKAVKDFLSKF